MAEVKWSGYQDLRDHIEATWTYIELRNENNQAILRLPISDPRVQWVHSLGDQVLQLKVTIKGSDPDINLPQTIAGSAIYKVPTGGDALCEETFVKFTLISEEDEITIRHQIQVPEVR